LDILLAGEQGRSKTSDGYDGRQTPMLSLAAVALASLAWLALMFGTALYAERRPNVLARHWHHVYALSLAVHCTSWTFYGTVTQAARYGWPFPPPFLGSPPAMRRPPSACPFAPRCPHPTASAGPGLRDQCSKAADGQARRQARSIRPHRPARDAR